MAKGSCIHSHLRLAQHSSFLVPPQFQPSSVPASFKQNTHLPVVRGARRQTRRGASTRGAL
eukprot:5537266-Amphidinium_carterae.2